MVARVSMAKTRVYADEPQIYIVSGLRDNEYSNWWKFKRWKYRDEHSPGDNIGWDEISDSSIFGFDPSDVQGLPATWSMDQVRQLYAQGASWTKLSWNPSTGTMAVYGAPRGDGYPKYRYELFVRGGSSGATYNHAIEWSVIRENMPESLRATYLPASMPAPPVIEEPPITIPPSDGTYNPPPADNTVPTIPELPPISQPPASTLPAISAGTAIGGAALAYVLFTKSGQRLLRRFKL